MKTFLFIFWMSLSLVLPAQEGIEFFSGGFQEALSLAKKEDKTIFVDAYTTWCGPCKRMKKHVFPDKSVGEFYNEHFINLAIDMETQEGKAFQSLYPVSGYPTLLFIDSEGKLVLREVGARDIDRFLELGSRALKANDRSDQYAERYEKGERDFSFMMKYMASLISAGKPNSAIAYKYLEEAQNLSDEQKALFIFEATESCDSRLFNMMGSEPYKSHILAGYGDNAYQEKVESACWNTVHKGLEFGVNDLLKEAKSAYKRENRPGFPVFATEVDLAAAKYRNDAAAYVKAGKKYMKMLKSDSSISDFLMESIDGFTANPLIGSFALEASAKLLKRNSSIESHYRHARVLYYNERFSECLVHIDIALERANKEKQFSLAGDISRLKTLAQNRI